MSTQQKVIKYVAIALAVWLTVSIIGGILGAIGIFGTFFGNDAVEKETKMYEVSADIRSLEIEIKAADITIREGENFSVESNLKKLNVEEKNSCLSIVQKGNFRGSHDGAVLTITVPSGTLEGITLKTGAGRFTAENLAAHRIHFEFGAGDVTIGSLTATKSAHIEGGAGRVTISGGSINDLEMDMGLGQVNLTSALTGDCELEAGVGESNINLIGTREDYTLEIEKGLGSISVDGEKVNDFGTSGNGANEVEIHGGVGAINVNFKEESNK